MLMIRFLFLIQQKFVRKNNNIYHLCAFKNLENHLNQPIQMAKKKIVLTELLKDLVIQVLAVSATDHSWKHS